MYEVATINNSSAMVINEINADVFSSFINYIDASRKTVETYTKSLKQLFNFFTANDIKQPTREDILKYKDELTRSGKKATTIQNYITACKIFFSWTEQEHIYPNISNHIKGAKISREHKKDYLNATQVKSILNTIDTASVKGKREYALMCLMITCGLRTVEVSRANVEDLRTLGNGTVLYIQGKGKEEKSDYVKISANVETAIREYLKTRNNIKAEEPLFVSTSNNNNNSRMTTRSISGIVKNILVRSGFDSERLTAHSLRHTAVTLSLLNGMELAEVQQFARHSNIATTMIYNHSIEKSKNKCADTIANAIF